MSEDTSAFPLHLHGDWGKGMTLRDYFAAAALQGMLAQPLDEGASFSPNLCARDSYKFADAMLAARKEARQ
jgi:hypothetical protein